MSPPRLADPPHEPSSPTTIGRGPFRGESVVVAWVTAGLILLFVMIAVAVVFAFPIDDVFDQIQHYSFILALRDHPTLFPDYGSYRILARDLVTWTSEENYISHPPLYYLLMAPLTAMAPGHPELLRFVSVGLAIGGLIFAFVGLRHRFPTTGGRLLFAILLFGPAEAVKLAGFINNDDLLVLESGVLIFALFGRERRPVLAAVMLAAAGWTKFNGFVALAAFVGSSHLLAVAGGRDRLFGRAGMLQLAAVAVGAVPTVAVWLTWGRLVWIPDHYPSWFDVTAPEMRATIGFTGYAWRFFHELGWRFPFKSDTVDALPLLAALALLALPALRPRASEDGRSRDLARASVIATAFFTTVLLVFGWRIFVTTGLSTVGLPRYFLMLWPSFAFTVALGVTSLPGPWERPIRLALIVAFLAVSAPFMPALAQLGLFGRS